MALVPLRSSASDLRLAHQGSLLVACFDGWPNSKTMKALVEAQGVVSRQFGKVAILSIIPAVDPQAAAAAGQLNQPADERASSMRESATTGEQLESTTLASALVILPRGLLAVMIRSFVGAVALINRSRTPLQTFKDVAPAVEWLATLPGVHVPEGLVADVEAWLGGRAAP